MKSRHFLFLFAVAVSLFPMQQSMSQGTTSLFVSAMPGFPALPQDTAYEQATYGFDIIVKNNTNTQITSGIAINMRVDSSVVTIGSVLQPNLLAGDSLIINIPVYNFTQPFFKAGNNIVVVWPVLSPAQSVMVDSLIKDVFFVPLNSLENNTLTKNEIAIFPVPATTFLQIYSPVTKVEYVRIYNTYGQIILDKSRVFNSTLDIRFLEPGVYFLEAWSDGKRSAIRFVKT